MAAPTHTRLAALLGAASLGALAEYFFIDRQHAARRRHMARDRVRGRLRRGAHASVRRAKYLEGVMEGLVYKTAHAVPALRERKEQPDDVTLAQKVESTAFRKAHVPKEHVSVNAENGVIFLRGQLERQEDIEVLVRMAAAVDGVRQVRNMLHTPDHTAPRGS